MDQLMKVQDLRCAALLQEKCVLEGDALEGHLLHGRKLRQPELVNWREWHPVDRYYLRPLKELPRKTGGQPREPECTDGAGASRVSVEELVDPRPHLGER